MAATAQHPYYAVRHSYDHTIESTHVIDGECFTCYVLACDDEANDR